MNALTRARRIIGRLERAEVSAADADAREVLRSERLALAARTQRRPKAGETVRYDGGITETFGAVSREQIDESIHERCDEAVRVARMWGFEVAS